MTESENACKSNCGRTKDNENVSQDQKESENLYKEIRHILNMLTPQNFAKLMYLVKILPIYTTERLETVIDLVSEKAIRDQRYSKCYASMCNQLSEVQIPYQNEEGRDVKYNFTKLIITKCLSEIVSEIHAELDEKKRLEEIRNYADPELYQKIRDFLDKLTQPKYDKLMYQFKFSPINTVERLERVIDHVNEQELYKKVRGILNKLTPQKFDKLMHQVKSLPINTVERLERVIDLVFEKAVHQQGFSKFYANMCKQLSELEVSYQNEEGKDVKSNFRKLIINKCQSEFESEKYAELDLEKRLEGIRNCADPEKKKELQSTFEEDQRRVRIKSVGNIRFIGELFKLGMLTPGIMFRCLQPMLKKPKEESLECLCKLLATIGKDLEASKDAALLNPIFNQMHNLSQKHENSKVSSRVRFMLQDVIDLRKNKWIPRRDDDNPKTIDQFTKEAKREMLKRNIALNQLRAKNYYTLPFECETLEMNIALIIQLRAKNYDTHQFEREMLEMNDTHQLDGR